MFGLPAHRPLRQPQCLRVGRSRHGEHTEAAFIEVPRWLAALCVRAGCRVPLGHALGTICAVVPSAVCRLVDEWRAAGSPPQVGIEWPRQRWVDQFPAHAQGLAALPGRLSRQLVRQACLDAAGTPAAALDAFIAVMAWGYGRVGYGPFRVRRVLASVPDPGERLQVAAGELARGGPAAAYALLGDGGVPRLPGLGPAFGTKFLYSPSSSRSCSRLRFSTARSTVRR